MEPVRGNFIYPIEVPNQFTHRQDNDDVDANRNDFTYFRNGTR